MLFTVRVHKIYFIHQMVIHNATKLLPLSSQTKLTLTVNISYLLIHRACARWI